MDTNFWNEARARKIRHMTLRKPLQIALLGGICLLSFSCLKTRNFRSESFVKETALSSQSETSGVFSSAVEIELQISQNPYFFKRLTKTADDTLLGLLNGIEKHRAVYQIEQKTEREWKDLFAEKLAAMQLNEGTKWSQLDSKQKLEVINALTALLRPKFNSENRNSRRIPGLFLVDFYQGVSFTDGKKIGSQYFAQGTQGFPLQKFLAENEIEYANPFELSNANIGTVEFKLRDKQALLAGDSLKMAHEFLTALSLPNTAPRAGQHIHAVFNLNNLLNQLARAGAPEPTDPTPLGTLPKIQFTEYFRRLNLFMDAYVPVVEKTNIVAKTLLFEYLKPYTVKEFFAFLGQDHSQAAPFDRLFASVAFHPTGKYDDQGLAGFEFRNFALAPSRTELAARILNTLHRQLAEARLPVPTDKLSGWFKAKYPRRPEDKYAPLLSTIVQPGSITGQEFKYFATDETVLGTGGYKLQEEITKFSKSHDDKYFAQHQELKFLTHDWAKDPIVFQNDNFDASQIQQLRLAALSELMSVRRDQRDSAPTSPIVRKFLIESGLFKLIAESLDLGFAAEGLQP